MHLQNHNIEESGFEGKGRQVESENQGSRATAAKARGDQVSNPDAKVPSKSRTLMPTQNQGSRATAAKVDMRIRVRGQGPLGVENDIRVRGEELPEQGGNQSTLQSWFKNHILV